MNHLLKEWRFSIEFKKRCYTCKSDSLYFIFKVKIGNSSLF